jgi:lauroyl/myristoyl acyltransferase
LFVIREGRGKIRLHIEPTIWPSEASSAADPVLCLTQRYAQVIERAVRQFPTQWLMFQHAFRQPSAAKEVSERDALMRRDPRVQRGQDLRTAG